MVRRRILLNNYYDPRAACPYPCTPNLLPDLQECGERHPLADRRHLSVLLCLLGNQERGLGPRQKPKRLDVTHGRDKEFGFLQL